MSAENAMGLLGLASLLVIAVGIAGAPTAFLMRNPRAGMALTALAVFGFGSLLFVLAAAYPSAERITPRETSGLTTE